MEQYYYLDANNQQKGPVGLAELIPAGVRQQTMIWKKGMPNWQQASAVPEVAALFVETIEPTPPPMPTQRTYTETPRTYTQTAAPRPNMGVKPDNYLVWSILLTAICCLSFNIGGIFGIAAIVYSTRVDSLWNTGNVEGAKQAAKQAKTFCWVSFGLGIAFYVLYLIYVFGIIGLAALQDL